MRQFEVDKEYWFKGKVVMIDENQDTFARAWLVDMPKNALWGYTYLASRKSDGKAYVYRSDFEIDVREYGLKVTEAEAKEKYPNFKWVSLEELENEI